MRIGTLFLRVLSLLAVFIVLAIRPVSAQAPPSDEITIKMKLFDSNDPKKELIPREAIVFIRNFANNQPQFLPNRKIEPVEGEAGFFQVKIPKRQLIEQLIILVSNASGTNYNPGVVAKVVSAADMTIYPGASDPSDKFGFTSYASQLEVYRTIFNQLVEEFSSDPTIRQRLSDAFGPQLRQMAEADARGALVNFTPQQLAAARASVTSLLKLYGLLPEVRPSPQSIVQGPPVQTHPNYPYPNYTYQRTQYYRPAYRGY